MQTAIQTLAESCKKRVFLKENMSEIEKFKRYCSQLEKYGQVESVHSPVMALLRRKARKQLIEVMKHERNCTSSINKLWFAGYYHPYQFYIREEESVMETITLLTMFCGELQEMLMLTDQKYSAIWNLYIADLHRYMSDDEFQKTLASGYYTRALELDPENGRAFQMISQVRTDLSCAQKLRLIILGQLAENPHKQSNVVLEFLKSSEAASDESLENFLIEFASWGLNEVPKRVDHQLSGLKLIDEFKSMLETDTSSNWAMIMSACRLVAKLAYKKFQFNQFLDGFDAITSFYLELYSKQDSSKALLAEAIQWIYDSGEIFSEDDPVKKEPYLNSLSVFAKTKWNELNDVVAEQINSVFESELFAIDLPLSNCIGDIINGPISEPSSKYLSQLVMKLISLKQPTLMLRTEKSAGEKMFQRINQSQSKRLDIPMDALIQKVNELNREDWRPVYVLMDYDALMSKPQIAHKIWDINDFICILPSTVLDKLDEMKTKMKSVRPMIRSLMELQAQGRITLKKCDNERDCAEQLVKSAKRSANDHKHIVAFLCKNPEDQISMEGVSFYDINRFYAKYLE